MRGFAGLVAIVVGASMALAGQSIGQEQTPRPGGQRAPSPGSPAAGEKMVHGQVASVHPSLTEITLTDGTTLVAPPGKLIRPGLVTEGATVIASYKEEGGAKIMTELVVAKEKEPSASPPSEPRSPGAVPPMTPPTDRPRR